MTRLLLANCAVLLAAALALVLTPATVSTPVAFHEVLVIVGGLVVLVLANLFLLRRAFAPLIRLTALMDQVNDLSLGPRIPVYGGGAEIAHLTRAFNDMLDRLEDERRASWQRAIEAQEGERLRVAQELHDEIGQALTAVKLLLARSTKGSPESRAAAVADAQEITDSTLRDVRQIASRLRPETLDELGLGNALATLAEQVAGYSDLTVERSLQRGLPALDRTTELVIYRVAQEALTNAVRHAGALRVRVGLALEGDELRLEVEDDGRGINGGVGNGIKGMHERALMVGGHLELGPREGGGTRLRLGIPIDRGAPAS